MKGTPSMIKKARKYSKGVNELPSLDNIWGQYLEE
jgi:hypothetical protein